MITLKTLNNSPSDNLKQSVRMQLYFSAKTPAAANLKALKREFSKQYGQEVSFSVLIAFLLDFYLNHRHLDTEGLKITGRTVNGGR